MKKALILCALGTALLGSQVAKADSDTFAGSASFTDTSSILNNTVYFTGTFDNPNFSFTGGPGTTYTDNLTINSIDLALLDKTQTDGVQISLTFNLPDVENGNIGGSGSVTDTFLGIFYLDSNTIDWTSNDPATINFGDGSQLLVSVPDVTFFGFDGGSQGCDPVTFTVTSAAPEPGSLALLGTSILGGAGLFRRRFKFKA
jgi:hypothetical protein